MRKILLLMGAILLAQGLYAQKWDQKMLVKNISIDVTADAFTATTIIEIEFSNPGKDTIEGRYDFELDNAQVITGFQLELNGRFREGSISEKQKARRTYSTIVGKRIDPALLQQLYNNYYSLNIYPILPFGSRRIKFEIQQLLLVKNDTCFYSLPFRIRDTVEDCRISAKVFSQSGRPATRDGMLTGKFFNGDGPFTLETYFQNKSLQKPLSFFVPFSLVHPTAYSSIVNGRKLWVVRLAADNKRMYDPAPQRITVFWDVSVSARRRNIIKEVAFLTAYIKEKRIRELQVITFNQHIRDTMEFVTSTGNEGWASFLLNQTLEGATDLSNLDFSSVRSDVIFLFNNQSGSCNSLEPRPGFTHVYYVTSCFDRNSDLEKVIGSTGGKKIDLLSCTVDSAVKQASTALNLVLGVKTGNNTIIPFRRVIENNQEIVLAGWADPTDHELILQYGNNEKVNSKETIVIETVNLNHTASSRIGMFDSLNQLYKMAWEDQVNFGQREGIVTWVTSYIVLERVEDYIKFNIIPPPELRNQCNMDEIVKANSYRKAVDKKQSETEILSGAADAYNYILRWWDKDEGMISFNDQPTIPEEEMVDLIGKPIGTTSLYNIGIMGAANYRDQGGDEELVVTAYGIARRTREIGFATVVNYGKDFTSPKLVQMLSGKAAGLTVYNTSVIGNEEPRITLRGNRSIGNNNTALIVLDGIPVPGNTLNYLNPADISSVTLLKGGQASALYGSEAINGVILVNTNYPYIRTRYYSTADFNYRLKDREDVDYLEEMKETPVAAKFRKFEELRNEHLFEAAFYYDMAVHFHALGYLEKAREILYSALDVCNNDDPGIIATAYILQEWGEYDDALLLLKQLISHNREKLFLYRDIALLYYQKKDYQSAIDWYYEGIITDEGSYGYYNGTGEKAMMLEELNSIICAHGDSLDLKRIEPALIRVQPVDLRITLDNNINGVNSMDLLIPSTADGLQPLSINRGFAPQFRNFGSTSKECLVRNALPGKYRLRIKYYGGYYNYYQRTPSIMRMIVFKHFATANQSLSIENIFLDNQYGNIEVAEFNY